MAACAGRSGSSLLPDIGWEIARLGGKVTYARFMELALTHPAYGYYSRAKRFLGRRGDFTTVPTLVPEFAHTLAFLLLELADGLSAYAGQGAEAQGGPRPAEQAATAVIELGPGEGHLAAAVLDVWQRERPDLRARTKWRMVETSPGLRAQQASVLSRFMRQGWQVEWHSSLVDAFSASPSGPELRLVYSNELFDVLPVHRVRIGGEGGGVREAYVRLGPLGLLEEEWLDLSSEAARELGFLFQTQEAGALLSWSEDGHIELRPGVHTLLDQARRGAKGVCLLTVDYGEWFGTATCAGQTVSLGAPGPSPGSAARAEPSEPSSGCGVAPWCGSRRYKKTVRAYFRHEVTNDLYSRVGRQDLTADVDFRALDLHGRALGYETVFFLTLAEFLNGGQKSMRSARARAGGEEKGQARRSAGGSGDWLAADRRASVLRALLDPADLGGVFKVMLQVWEAQDTRPQTP